MRLLVFFLSIWLLAPITSRADALEDAEAAYIAHDYAAAFTLIEPLAKSGNAAAQFNLAELYYDGNGIEKDCMQALHWYQKAADGGNAEAIEKMKADKLCDEVDLVALWADTKKNDPDAKAYIAALTENARRGDADSELQLAREYNSGNWIAPDRKESSVWLHQALVNGDNVIKAKICRDFYSGPFFASTKPTDRAISCQGGAQAGEPRSQYELAMMYRGGGEGLAPDLAEAYFWFRRTTAAQGKQFGDVVKFAADAVMQIRKQLSPAKLADVESRLQVWKPSEIPLENITLVPVPKLPRERAIPEMLIKECTFSNEADSIEPLVELGKKEAPRKPLNSHELLCHKNSERATDLCGDVIGVDINSAGDGPYYFKDRYTEEMLGSCSYWSGECIPPKRWKCGRPKNYQG